MLRRGGAYHLPAYEAWLETVRYEAAAQLKGRSVLSPGPWWVEIIFHGSARLNSDADNCCKGPLDSLTGILWPIDSWKYVQKLGVEYLPVINPRDRRTEIRAGLLCP